MKQKTTILLAIIIGSIAVLACAAWAVPQALSLYYQGLPRYFCCCKTKKAR